MPDIRFDTSHLTWTAFVLEGRPDVIDAAVPVTLSLPPGDYAYRHSLLTAPAFRFTVTPEGLLEYADEYAGFLSGAGSTSLTVIGFAVTLDGRGLSHDLRPYGLYSSADVLDRAAAQGLRLLPGADYRFQPAGTTVGDFSFAVDTGGNIVLDPKYGGFASVSGTTLTITGYPVTVDARTLSTDLRPYAWYGVNDVFSRNAAFTVHLLPGTGFQFVPAGTTVADFVFSLDTTGSIVIDPKYGGFASVSGTTLTIAGYPVTVDAQTLSTDLRPYAWYGVNDVFSRNAPFTVHLLPGTGFQFMPAGTTVGEFSFAVDTDGGVSIDPKYSAFTSVSGTTLTIIGYPVTVDARALATDLRPYAWYGVDEVFSRNAAFTVHLLPGTGFQFMPAGTTVADFAFSLDTTGNIVIDPKYSAFTAVTGTTLTIAGYPVTVDARALSTDLRPYAWYGVDEVFSRNAAFTVHLLPGTGFQFMPAGTTVGEFSFAVDTGGNIVLDPKYGGFASVGGTTLTITGYPVTVDARALSTDLRPYAWYGVDEVFSRNAAFTVHLLPGTGFQFMPAGTTVADFVFSLDTTGSIVIDPKYSGFTAVSGTTLTIAGYPVTVDARALSTDLRPYAWYGVDEVFSRNAAFTVHLLPGTGFQFMPAGTTVGEFSFAVDTGGNIVLDPKYSGFTAVTGTTLTITGYPVIVDARALSTDLRPYAWYGVDDVFSRSLTFTLRLIPGTNLQFQPAGTTVGDFAFGLDTTGQVLIDPKYNGFAQVTDAKLTISGYPVTVDARALSTDLRPYAWYGVDEVFPPSAAFTVHLLPGKSFQFMPAGTTVGDFAFDLDTTGQVLIDPKYNGFAQVTDAKLTISGYPVTVDARALSTDLRPYAWYGVDEVFPRSAAFTVHLLPGKSFQFMPAGTTVGDFAFDLDTTGQVLIDPKYNGFAQVTDAKLTISGYPVNVDARALSTDLRPYAWYGVDETFSRTDTFNLTLLPGHEYRFMPAATTVGDFSFGVSVDGGIAVNARFAGFATVHDSTLTLTGYSVTIDITALSTDLHGYAMYGLTEPFPHGTTTNLTLLPGHEYRVQSAAIAGADFYFGLDAAGAVQVDPKYGGFAAADGAILRISGYQITVDGRGLDTDLIAYTMYGLTDPLTRDTTHNLTLIPDREGDPYILRTATGGHDYRFILHIDGTVTMLDPPGPLVFPTSNPPVPAPRTSTPPDDLWSELDTAIPIAMVPLRIESRYGTRTDTAPDGSTVVLPVLRVRIYPDEVSVTAATPGLSTVERTAGTDFWDQQGDAPLTPTEAQQEQDIPGTIAHRQRAAWEVLVRRVGAARAGYVAGSAKPGGVPVPDQVSTPRTARLLPDKFVITGTLNEHQVFARVITGPHTDPQIGTTQSNDAFDPHDPHLVAPEDGVRWLTDFERAVQFGMAAVIDLASVDDVRSGTLPPVVTAGLDSLVVVGVRSAGEPDEHASQLADLLTEHGQADRVAFIAQGTPTNNLTERSSGWTSQPDLFAGYDAVRNPAARQTMDTGVPALSGGATDSEVFERALGLADGVTAGLEGASGQEQWLARNMALTLFPVGIGEVVGTLTRRASANGDQERALTILDSVLPFAREHVAGFVRGRGPIPALRIGRQPYGILPITAWRHWSRMDAEPEHLSRLAQILGVLRPCWEQASAKVAALDANTAQTPLLARILGHGPVPHPGGYQVRPAYGPVSSYIFEMATAPETQLDAPTLTNIAVSVAQQQWAVQSVQLAAYRQLLTYTLGDLLHETHLQHMWLADEKPLRVHVAATNKHRAGWETPGVYLRRLAGPHPTDGKPNDLLFVLAEHALGLAGELDAQYLLFKWALEAFKTVAVGSPEIAASELSAGKSVQSNYTTPIRDIAGAAIPLDDHLSTSSVADIVVSDDLRRHAIDVLGIPKIHVNGYAGTRDAVKVLGQADLSDGDYTRLTGETLACASTRLDAWVTSIAMQRLSILRDGRPTGVRLGAWGLLVDVRPRPAAPIADALHIPPQWPNVAVATPPEAWRNHLATAGAGVPPLVQPDRQVGYIHAPSIPQAVTGGVLRAGELAHQGDGSSLASIDLTSARVRAARDILESMSNGQPLGALLGYRLERAMGDAGLQRNIAALRSAYPQRRSSGALGQPVDKVGSDSVVPAEVVDGYEVLQARDAAAAACGLSGVPKFTEVLDTLQRVTDAVADVIVAEGVHHITTGRPEVAGALFKATAEGTQPPELTVVNEPRSGITVTDRILIALDPTAAGTAGWNKAAPRAKLAPAAERWAETIVGPAQEWTISVGDRDVRLDGLGICALDVLVESRVEQTGVRSLDARLGGPVADPDETYQRLLALARSAHDVLASSRPVVHADVTDPQTADTAGPATVEPVPPPSADDVRPVKDAIAEQVTALTVAVMAVVNAAQNQLGADPVDPDLLSAFAELGLSGSPSGGGTPTVSDAVAAASAAGAVIRDVDATLRRALPNPPDDDSRATLLAAVADNGDIGTLVAVARRIGGDAVVPTIAASSGLSGAAIETPSAEKLDTWLSQMGRVRRAIGGYDDLRLFTEAVGRALNPLSVYQLPLPRVSDPTPDRWLGEELAETPDPASPEKKNKLRRIQRPRHPRTHIVAEGAPGVLARPTLHGVVIDEVTETLPADTVTTGLALHYDAPNARPPQTILLAVHPNPSQAWSWQLLTETAREAMALAKLRGVELDDLAGTGIDEFFPLTYVRDKVEDATPLDELTREPIWLLESIAANRVFLER